VNSFLQYVILGLGAGAAYTLLAQGVVLIYRGSGIVNFAQGAIAMVGGYLWYVTCETNLGWSFWPSFLVGVLAATAIGLIFQQVVLRAITRAGASPLTKVIATLGLLIVVQALVIQKYTDVPVTAIPQYLPAHLWHAGKILIEEDRIILLVIAGALTTALWAWSKFTKTGLAITASAENERAVSTLGWSPNKLGAITWGLGSALAGAAGILLGPVTGLDPIGFVLVVTISGLAAALVGGFRSFPLTMLGGMILGIGQSVILLWQTHIASFLGLQVLTGSETIISFIVIIVVLVVRGRGLPLRSHVVERLPKLGSGIKKWPEIILATVLVGVIGFFFFNSSWQSALSYSLLSGIIILSVIILTGFTGQLSLAQYAIAGMGAVFASNLIEHQHLDPLLALIAGALLAVPASLLFAIPALRTRGVNLAVVTLSLGYTVQEIIFTNTQIIGNINKDGTPIGVVHFFGINVNSLVYPQRWVLVCLIAFVLVALMTANLRRSASGRRLLAVRTNERAAASLGISVFRAKIYAFGVAGAFAAIGGILIGYQFTVTTYTAYDAFSSIYAVAYAVIGGVGYVIGAALGAGMVPGGLGTNIFNLLHLGTWTATIGGVILLVLVIFQPNGGVEPGAKQWGPLMDKLLRRKEVAYVLPQTTAERVAPGSLVVNEVGVRFGGVVAVDGVSLEVNAGQVVGLIGPNGAGKTTFIDSVTGFVRTTGGSIILDGVDVTSWSAAKRSGSGIRRSFQSLELFEDLTVLENLRSGTKEVGRWSFITDLFWPKQKDLPPTAVAAVREFGLEDKLNLLPTDLSYGQRRLVAIARAVASGPSILLLDEPAAGLDETESRELATLIRRLADERGMGILLVEHDVALVMSTCDRVVVIDFGRKIADGTPEVVREDANVIAAYLGEQQQEEVEVSGE